MTEQKLESVRFVTVCLSAFNNLMLCTSNTTHEGSAVCWAVQCLPPASPAIGRLGGHTGHGRGVGGEGGRGEVGDREGRREGVRSGVVERMLM